MNPNLNETQFPREMKVKRRVDDPARWGAKQTVERIEPVIHRGVGIPMTTERASRFHAAQSPEEKAAIVMEHVQSSSHGGSNNREGWDNALGSHWTTTPSVARGFTGHGNGPNKELEKYGLPQNIPVMFHAEPPAPSHVYSEGGQAHAGFGPRHFAGEDETTLRKNAPVKLVGMSFPEKGSGPDDNGYGPYVPVSAKLHAGSRKPY